MKPTQNIDLIISNQSNHIFNKNMTHLLKKNNLRRNFLQCGNHRKARRRCDGFDHLVNATTFARITTMIHQAKVRYLFFQICDERQCQKSQIRIYNGEYSSQIDALTMTSRFSVLVSIKFLKKNMGVLPLGSKFWNDIPVVAIYFHKWQWTAISKNHLLFHPSSLVDFLLKMLIGSLGGAQRS